ncbi:helix-turn-helix domain-containing protein [Acinetobacter cumulans]|mgnify:FL=1|jgi:hypothetical protein|uniref:Helix-turn-helix domain-containing protein n=1 Tax=Acinetobacter cumulans TaxID=2136182 RepID=A0A3A8FNE7_9GAMM|nr:MULTISPECIES: helix-turn-helix domain-containing protein [Acinetobacter]RFS35925.1 helix-turn-helix domain-containing protein [Acinetobacter sp. SWAC5]RKG37346.1 helix-turn-helix domain-containing protein [Acinetobacter cumulans]RKG48262.1 helix-turn-helix domain-containing protein [Acinetobacter cumulans]RKG48683.1 helix-turn-helix domain-containing protein [Acinetobacter cumulans]RLL31382.1 helix-turn-helix domain-containing protein [Acinetobacter cumulans]
MNKQYINIAISGLSIHDAEELKGQLSNIIDNKFNIQWKTATDINLDCLFIHENFFDTEGIQRILNNKSFPWLKVAKDNNLSGKLENNTLYLPIQSTQDLNQWIDQHIIHNDFTPPLDEPVIPVKRATQATLKENHPYTESYFKTMYDTDEGHHKLYISDAQGALGVIDIKQNLVFCNSERKDFETDFSFNYEFASTSHLIKASRKDCYILQDWIWNLFWFSPNFYQIAPEDGHYRIHFWPKPQDRENRKQIFQMSACFIQGAKISKISEQHNIPIQTVRRFIAANMASGNLSKINIWDNHYNPPETLEEKPEESLIKSFFGKIRRKFGF